MAGKRHEGTFWVPVRVWAIGICFSRGAADAQTHTDVTELWAT